MTVIGPREQVDVHINSKCGSTNTEVLKRIFGLSLIVTQTPKGLWFFKAQFISKSAIEIKPQKLSLGSSITRTSTEDMCKNGATGFRYRITSVKVNEVFSTD